MVRLLLRPAAAAEMQAISIAYLGQLRRDGLLKEGIHYREIAPNRFRYYAEAIDNFFENRTDPKEHERWIQRLAKELAAQDRGLPRRSA
jgi:hypothetical protein